MDLNLMGMRALVTGSTAGIGADVLAAEGAAIVVHGRNAERAEKFAAELRSAGGKVAITLGELTDASSFGRLEEATGNSPRLRREQRVEKPQPRLDLDPLGVDELADAEVGALAAVAGVLDADDRHSRGRVPGAKTIEDHAADQQFRALGPAHGSRSPAWRPRRRFEGLAHRPHEDEALGGEPARRRRGVDVLLHEIGVGAAELKARASSAGRRRSRRRCVRRTVGSRPDVRTFGV
jgi:NAD(P)-dependent dehydrogenase (short-subunit alcohol dehydrogenase family)